jgi:hypothetical protein
MSSLDIARAKLVAFEAGCLDTVEPGEHERPFPFGRPETVPAGAKRRHQRYADRGDHASDRVESRRSRSPLGAGPAAVGGKDEDIDGGAKRVLHGGPLKRK